MGTGKERKTCFKGSIESRDFTVPFLASFSRVYLQVYNLLLLQRLFWSEHLAKNEHLWISIFETTVTLHDRWQSFFANRCMLRLHKQLIVRALAVLILVLLLQLCFVPGNRFFTDVPIHNVGSKSFRLVNIQQFQFLKYSKTLIFLSLLKLLFIRTNEYSSVLPL